MSQKAYQLRDKPEVKRWVHEQGHVGYQGLVPAGVVEEDWEEVPFVSDLERTAAEPKVNRGRNVYDAYIAAGYSVEEAQERSGYTEE